MDRAELRRAVEKRLGRCELVWFGTRGDDAEGIADVDQFSAAFSIINQWARRSHVYGLALEQSTGRRVDLDTYDLDEDLAPDRDAKQEFRRTLLSWLTRRSVIFTYRPTSFLSSIGFARLERCEMAGLFRDHQAAFEHKPWVETSIASLGVPHIRWKYIADEERLQTMSLLHQGPTLLRRSRTTGGTGISYLDDPSHLAELWPQGPEAFVSVAPFEAGATPLNVSGVVWHDGVTIHPVSLQLIGVTELTARRFGYCGNDFAAAGEMLDGRQLDEVEATTRTVGEWLRRHGYLGAYGVDFLVVEGVPTFLEVNPRFQGSSRLSCQISSDAGESCLMLEHLAASLGLSAPASRTAAWYAKRAAMSQAVVHASGNERGHVDPKPLVANLRRVVPGCQIDVATRAELFTETGATICRLAVSGRVTTTGFDFDGRLAEAVREWRAERPEVAPAEERAT